MESFETILSSEGNAFLVHTGISEILLEQLVAASIADDEALKKFTDDSVRFTCLEEAQKWLQEGIRRVYTLTPKDQPDILAGFGWFREEPVLHTADIVNDSELFAEYQSTRSGVYTVAARMYGEYRGQRLATPFMELAHREYSRYIGENIATIIALIHSENIPSQKLFARLGYQLAGTQKNRTFWILNHANWQRYTE